MRSQIIVEVNPKNVNTHLSKVNEKLAVGWLVKQIVVCNDNAIHYLLEKTDGEAQAECLEFHKDGVHACQVMKDDTTLRSELEELKRKLDEVTEE